MVNLKTKWGVATIQTTVGKRYIITRDGDVSISHRTYYKKKSNALKKANSLNLKE